MARLPELWVFAGPNGSAKTSFATGKPLTELLGEPALLMLNPDDRTRQILVQSGVVEPWSSPEVQQKEAFTQAAAEILQYAIEGIRRGERVCVETVLSTDKYLGLIDEVHACGVMFALIYVALKSPTLSRDRIHRRMSTGGHNVPEERLESRWWKSIENLGRFAALADYFWVFDNSDSDPTKNPLLIAHGTRSKPGGQLSVIIEAPEHIPEITAALQPLISGYTASARFGYSTGNP